jgi:hypothetical protein
MRVKKVRLDNLTFLCYIQGNKKRSDMEKTIFETRIDEEMEEVVREIEQLELFCNNVFGLKDNSSLYTVQQWTFVYFYSYLEYLMKIETLSGMEKLASDFLTWQNVGNPETLFSVEGEDFVMKPFSHDDDFNWNSVMTLIKETARKIFIFRPEFPETKEDFDKRILKEEYCRSKEKSMDSFFEQRDRDVR